MVWPVSDVTTANADAGTDNPATFRADVLDLIQKFNQLRNHVSTNMRGVLAGSTISESSGNLTLSNGGPCVTTIGTSASYGSLQSAGGANNAAIYLNGATRGGASNTSTASGAVFVATDEIFSISNSTVSVNKFSVNANGTGIGLIPTARNNTRLQIVDGIGFPATQVPSTDPNTLDDYEEGTWTPSLGGTSVLSFPSGEYTKKGREVTVTGYIPVLVIGTGSTTLISGLPFVVGSGNFQGSCHFGGGTATAVASITARALAGATTVRLFSTTGAVTAMSTPAIFQNNTEVSFTLTYFV